LGLGKLILRHASKFYVFFDGGERLLSCKWIHAPSSTGYYEFVECELGRRVVVYSKNQVDWSDFEGFLGSWLDSHSGLLFDKGAIFDLVWRFFVLRNERYFSSNHDPLSVYMTMDLKNPLRRSLAADMIEEMSSSGAPATFWNSKASEIMSNYAHWFAG
jgi:hypothetical protein